MMKTPTEGQGKPKKLKYDLVCCWTRRINQEHRIVYEVGDSIKLHSLRGNYR